MVKLIETNLETLNKLINVFGTGIAIVNSDGKLTHVNQIFCNYLEFPREELITMTFPEFTHPEDIKSDLELFNKLLLGEIDNYSLDKRYITKSNKVVWSNLIVSIVRDTDTDNYYFLAIIKDITEEKTRQLELIKLNSELEDFVYLTSHDLREPVNSITTLIELFKMDYSETIRNAGGDGETYIDFIYRAAYRAKRLIDDLLDYSRLRKEDKEKEFFNLEELVLEVMEALIDKLKNPNIKFSYNLGVDIVWGYRTEIGALLQNLISNAIKFSKKDKENQIILSCELTENNYLFSVKDQGIGIEEKYFEKIFKIFKRLHSREEIEGTGIGLAQCKKVVGMHEGEIWLESEIGKGSNFKFTIPCKK